MFQTSGIRRTCEDDIHSNGPFIIVIIMNKSVIYYESPLVFGDHLRMYHPSHSHAQKLFVQEISFLTTWTVGIARHVDNTLVLDKYIDNYIPRGNSISGQHATDSVNTHRNRGLHLVVKIVVVSFVVIVSVSVSLYWQISALQAHHASAHGGVSTNGLSDILLIVFEMILSSCLK